MSDLRARIDALSQEQRALLERRLPRARRQGTPSGAAMLVAYVEGPEAPSTEDLRAHLRERLPDYMVPSAFVALEALPRTSTGKIDRRALPEPTRAKPVAAVPLNDAENTLALIWAEVLGFDEVGVHDDFFEMGGDSLLSIRIIARAHKAGLRITPAQFFDNPTVAGVAAVAETDAPAVPTAAESGGTVPLTPIQHWFFDLDLPDPHHWNQALLVDLPTGVTPAVAERALAHLVAHHDALRLCFKGRRQTVAPEITAPIIVECATADELHASFDLAKGQLVKAALLPEGLLLVLHHLLVDAVSWGILREDLLAACVALRDGRAVDLPRATSFRHWVRELHAYAQTDAAAAEAPWWLALGGEPLPADFEGANEVRTAESLVVELGPGETAALLRDVPAAYHARVNDALLTALAQACAPWTGRNSLRLDVEGHGRGEVLDDVDVSRTVGWFTTVYPIALELPGGDDVGDALRSIKEQLRQVPNGGLGHGVLRHLRQDDDLRGRLASMPRSDMVFNYLGRESMAPDARTGQARGTRGTRPYRIEINAGVTDGTLRATWTYSPNIHRRETIAALASRFLDALRVIVVHCGSCAAGGHTPSDFPLARVDQAQLDHIAGLLDDD